MTHTELRIAVHVYTRVRTQCTRTYVLEYSVPWYVHVYLVRTYWYFSTNNKTTPIEVGAPQTREPRIFLLFVAGHMVDVYLYQWYSRVRYCFIPANYAHNNQPANQSLKKSLMIAINLISCFAPFFCCGTHVYHNGTQY